MRYHRKRRETDGQKEKGRQDAVLYEKKDNCLIDVENVETTGEMCCHIADEHH